MFYKYLIIENICIVTIVKSKIFEFKLKVIVIKRFVDNVKKRKLYLINLIFFNIKKNSRIKRLKKYINIKQKNKKFISFIINFVKR